MWMRSGPVYSKDPVDTAIWIETTPKQRKYEAHDADMTDNPEGVYEEHRLTFEVVNYSRTASADNLYMDFLPILQDRGVKKEAIGAFVTRALEVEKRKLMDALQDPVSFRRYMHEQSCYPQEFVPDAEDGRQATKPKSFWDSIVLLLEVGSPSLAFCFLMTDGRGFCLGWV